MVEQQNLAGMAKPRHELRELYYDVVAAPV